MTIFPDTPKLTKADRKYLGPHISNAKACRKWLNSHVPPLISELKKAVLLEIESDRDITSRPIANMLIVRLQRNERHSIWARIAQAKGMWP